MTQMIRSFLMYYFIVTIQNLIRKTAANAAQVLLIEVTSPYKLCQMSLRMRALDVHIVIICMALNSYKKTRFYIEEPGFRL